MAAGMAAETFCIPKALAVTSRRTSLQHGISGQKTVRQNASMSISSRYQGFLQDIRREARARNISDNVIERGLALAPRPDETVLSLSRKQPEFTLSWAQYQQRTLSSTRLSEAVSSWHDVAGMLIPVADRFGCDSSVIMGVWGLESRFGAFQGRYNVMSSLATLAFSSRRSRLFRSELIMALKILQAGVLAPEEMLGSYAGAMGQPQFMPSAYLRFAADGDGDGRCDIWHSRPDVFASVSNFLVGHGWQKGMPWGQEVILPPDLGALATLPCTKTDRAAKRSVRDWQDLGVQPVAGGAFVDFGQQAALLQPDGPGEQAFLVYPNFFAIRSYNPSDYYALSVSLLGDAALGKS